MTSDVAEPDVDYNHPNPLIVFSMRQKAKEYIVEENVEAALVGYTITGIRELIDLFGEMGSVDPKKYPYPNRKIQNAVSNVINRKRNTRERERIAAGLNKVEPHAVESVRITRERNEFYKHYDGGKHYQSNVKDINEMPTDWIVYEKWERQIIADGDVAAKTSQTYQSQNMLFKGNTLEVSTRYISEKWATRRLEEFQYQGYPNNIQTDAVPASKIDKLEGEFQENKASMSLGKKLLKGIVNGLAKIGEYVARF